MAYSFITFLFALGIYKEVLGTPITKVFSKFKQKEEKKDWLPSFHLKKIKLQKERG
jgi:hypothetical protein